MLRYFSPQGDPKLFGCPCGDCLTKPNPRLPKLLDIMREETGISMVITSGPRCVNYNITIGGADYSEHIDGEGADVACSNSTDRLKLIKAALEVGINRIGVADTFIHFGISITNTQDVMWTY